MGDYTERWTSRAGAELPDDSLSRTPSGRMRGILTHSYQTVNDPVYFQIRPRTQAGSNEVVASKHMFPGAHSVAARPLPLWINEVRHDQACAKALNVPWCKATREQP